MQIVLTESDLSRLKASTRADLMATFIGDLQAFKAEAEDDDYWEGVVDLTVDQVEKFVAGCSQQTINGLKVIAKHGPKIHASLLDEAGIEKYGSFQGGTTKRARTITGDDDAYLITWDNWHAAEDGIGHYEVTETTYQSLRKFFDLD